MHSFLDDDADWRVVDWGDTDDTDRTHEAVRLVLEFALQHGEALLGATAVYVGKTLVHEGVDAVTVKPLKRLLKHIGRTLRSKAESVRDAAPETGA